MAAPAETERVSVRSLVLLGVGLLGLILAAAFGLLLLLWSIKPVDVAAGLTGVATTGGIISGLSVNGTAILALSGRYKKAVLDRYGAAVRFVLFGGFMLLVTASLGSAVSVVWIEQFWPRVVLALAIPTLLVVLVATALLISSAFKWEAQAPKTKPSPYQRPSTS